MTLVKICLYHISLTDKDFRDAYVLVASKLNIALTDESSWLLANKHFFKR